LYEKNDHYLHSPYFCPYRIQFNNYGTDKKPSLNHIALYVVDLKKSTAFYQKVIGIDTIPEPFHDGKHAWFSIGQHSQLHIIEGAKAAIPREKNTHLCFSVQSIESMIERLRK
jgi:lactoylglutathione lyase